MADSFPDMYNYITNSGVVVPSTDGVKSSVENMMVGIFGGELDVTPETPVGRLVEAITMMMRTTVGINAQNANQINPMSSTGAFLDGLAALFGLSRLPHTKTKAEVELSIKIPDNLISIEIDKGTLLGTSVGDVFETMDTVVANGDSGDIKTVKVMVEAQKYGVVPCPVGDLTQVLDTSDASRNIIAISNSTPALLGRDVESDYSLRTRIVNAKGNVGASTGAIANAIWKTAPYISGVMVLENGYGYPVVKSGISMKPHSIFVCVGGDTDSSINTNIARAIWNTKTVGADYVDDAAGGTKVDVSIDKTIEPSITSDDSYNVTFYKAKVLGVNITVNVNLIKYTGTGVFDEIMSIVSNLLANKAIGSQITKLEVASAISASLPTVIVNGISMSVNGIEYEKIESDALTMYSLGTLTVTQS